MSEKPSSSVVVWDLFVRVFHWSLVAGVTVAAITGFFVGATAIDVHVWVGLALFALVVARVTWGFLGSRLGHNPLGAWMILTILAAITFLAVSGLIVWGGIFAHGPFTGFYDFDDGQPFFRLHWWVALGLLALVALHIGGAIFESMRVHENLVRAMITGFKEPRENDAVEGAAEQPENGPRPGLTVLITLLVMAIPIGATFQASRIKIKVTHRPPDTKGTVYAENCSDCHGVYSPTLLPADSWRKLMAALDNHFGEDASLDADTTKQIEDYLVAHSAGSVETKPSAVFTTVSAKDPTRITASPFWVKTHRKIPDYVFSAKPVYSKGNCFACHSDAQSGWFYPGNIEVPDSIAPPKK